MKIAVCGSDRRYTNQRERGMAAMLKDGGRGERGRKRERERERR